MGVLVIGVVLVALLGAVAAWWLWRRRSAAGGSACGKCGYPAGGLETFTCPECGGDLRKVGIRVGSAGGVPRTAWVLMAWSLGLVLVAVPLSVMVVSHLPSVTSVGGTIVLRGPRSGAYRGVTIDYEGTGVSSAALTERATLTVDTGQPVVKQLTLGRPPTVEGKHPRAVFEGLLQSAGVDVGRPDVQLEVSEIEAFTGDVLSGKVISMSPAMFSAHSLATRGGVAQPMWWTILTGLGWALVWLLGVGWIVSRPAKAAC